MKSEAIIIESEVTPVVDVQFTKVDSHNVKKVETKVIPEQTITKEVTFDLEVINKEIADLTVEIAGLQAKKVEEVAAMQNQIIRFSDLIDSQIVEKQAELTRLNQELSDIKALGITEKPQPMEVPVEELPLQEKN